MWKLNLQIKNNNVPASKLYINQHCVSPEQNFVLLVTEVFSTLDNDIQLLGKTLKYCFLNLYLYWNR